MEPFLVPYEPYTGPRGTGYASSCVSGTSFIDGSRDFRQHWDAFYRSHKDATPYPDRHYLVDELPELAEATSLLEIGCGIGSTVAPLLGNSRVPHLIRVTCVDVSPVAIARLRRRGLPLVRGLVADITDGVLDGAPFDIVTFIFCLSAVPVDKMNAAARNAIASVRSGGVLYFRDYATDDLAQGRGSRGRLTWERLTKEEEEEDGQTTSYLRRNGTLSHFFSL